MHDGSPSLLRRARYDAGMLLVCLIWGANFTITKLAFASITPLAFTAIRYALGCFLLWGLVRVLEGPGSIPRGATLFRLIWLGLFGNTLYQLGFVLGLARGTATNTSLIISASPAVVAVLGAALGIERVTARARLGIALGIAGVALVVLARPGAALHLQVSAGDAFSLGALFSWAVYTVGLQRLEGLTPLRITAWTAYTGTPGLLLAGAPDLLRVRWSSVGAGTWLALGYAVVLSFILGYLIWNASVRAVGPTRTAIYVCFTPLVAVVVAWAALGERPGALHLIGGTLIVAGIALTRLSRG